MQFYFYIIRYMNMYFFTVVIIIIISLIDLCMLVDFIIEAMAINGIWVIQQGPEIRFKNFLCKNLYSHMPTKIPKYIKYELLENQI